jgi:hypothetical protein
MKTNKQLLNAFREQFNTGSLFTETQVLVLMGYARSEGKKEAPDCKPKKQFMCESTGVECPNVDTSGMTQTVECSDCEIVKR